jgi:DNA-directed RNA polymerase subunit RPC12/RpoP
MIRLCTSCGNDFVIDDKEFVSEEQMIKCDRCGVDNLIESQTSQLEKKLSDLDKDLIITEQELSNQNDFSKTEIEKLESELNLQKKELSKQKDLEDKIYIFEKRITLSEKENAKQADLENKSFQLQKEIEKTNTDIITKTKNIESKTNYIQMKISTINKKTKQKKSEKDFLESKAVVKKNDQTTKISTKGSQLGDKKKFAFWKN